MKSATCCCVHPRSVRAARSRRLGVACMAFLTIFSWPPSAWHQGGTTPTCLLLSLSPVYITLVQLTRVISQCYSIEQAPRYTVSRDQPPSCAWTAPHEERRAEAEQGEPQIGRAHV